MSRTVRARSEQLRTASAAIRRSVAAAIDRARAICADLSFQRLGGHSEDGASAHAEPEETAVRAALAPVETPWSPVPCGLAAAGLGEDDLDDLVESLIAAYRAAELQGDEVKHALLGWALRQLGQQLADRLGPRGAGIIVN